MGYKRTKYTAPPGQTQQTFSYTGDLTEEQTRSCHSHFGGRRFAFNWTVQKLIEQNTDYRKWRGQGSYGLDHRTITHTPKPEYPDPIKLRKEWNQEKQVLCVDRETGEPWWIENSKEAYANAIFDACGAFDRWIADVAENGTGATVGFPKYKKKGSDTDRFTIKCGAFRVVDRHHIQIPKIGVVRVHENTRKLARALEKGPEFARIKNVTVQRRGKRIKFRFQVDCIRPQRNRRPADPASVVGVDLGVRELAVVVNAQNEVVTRVPNPKALDRVLRRLKKACRDRSRCTKVGSINYRRRTQEIGVLHDRAANIRQDCIHKLTTYLAKNHGLIVVEGAAWDGLAQQKGSPGAKTRRRDLLDASPGEIRRQLAYKTEWYNSGLLVADRWFPSSKRCSLCGHVQKIGSAKEWRCGVCGSVHDRDVNAAFNLAQYPELDARDWSAQRAGACGLSPVGAAVKRGAFCGADPVCAGEDDPRASAATAGNASIRGSGCAVEKREEGSSVLGATGNPARGARSAQSTND